MHTQSLRPAIDVVAAGTATAAAVPAAAVAVACATVAAFEASIDKALTQGDASASALRAAQWGVVTAFHTGAINEEQGIALLLRAAIKRGVKGDSLRPEKARGLAALAAEPDAKAEKREERGPMSYGQSLINSRKKADKVKADADKAKVLRKEAGPTLAAEMGEEYTPDFATDYAPEIAERAAGLAKQSAIVAAIVSTLEAAKEAGVSRDRLAGMIETVYGAE